MNAKTDAIAIDVYNIGAVWAQVRKAGDATRQLANASASDIATSVALTGDTDLLQRYFDQALADHKAAREAKASAVKAAIAADWGLLSKRIRFHLDAKHLRVEFPNVNGAGGTVTLTPKTEALAAAKAAAAEKAAKDKAESDAHAARMVANELAAMSALSARDIADTLAESIEASGNSLMDVLAAFASAYPHLARDLPKAPKSASRKPRTVKRTEAQAAQAA